MESHLLNYFFTCVLSGTENDTFTTSPRRSTRHSRVNRNSTVVTWDQEGEVFNMMRRIHTLHCRARTEPNLSPDSISQAVQIWRVLDNWDPEDPPCSEEQSKLSSSYRSAFFIWIHFIIYPNDVDGWKVQDALHDILANMAGVERRDLLPFAIIPLFFSGLAATEQSDKATVAQQYERVRPHTQRDGFRASWGIVQRGWEAYDQGIQSGWDWI